MYFKSSRISSQTGANTAIIIKYVNYRIYHYVVGTLFGGDEIKIIIIFFSLNFITMFNLYSKCIFPIMTYKLCRICTEKSSLHSTRICNLPIYA